MPKEQEPDITQDPQSPTDIPEAEKPKLSIPLTKIVYEAKVAGTMASVTSRQVYKNENTVPVEAIYVFPLPDEASVVGCTVTIGKKKIEAELKEQKQARQEYEDALAKGHHAALVEQKRANIFKMSVGGIEPGEEIKVNITYHQRVEWQDNGGRFSIPTVVAPRFIPGVPSGAKTGGGWAPDTDEVPDASEITPVVAKDGVPYTVDIHAELMPGFACKVTSPSHGSLMREREIGKGLTEKIELVGLLPNRDFILVLALRAKKVDTAVHAGSFGGAQFASISIVPPVKAAVGKKKRILLILDNSGSMSGAKIHGLKVVAHKAVERLEKEKTGHEVGIVGFDTQILFDYPLSAISDATYKAIESMRAQGGTRAGMALDYGFAKFGDVSGEDYILLVGDGQTADMWRNVKPGVRVIGAGIDAALNEDYLRQIAKETKGANYWIYPGEDYDKVAGKIVGLLSGPVLTDVTVVDPTGNSLPDVVGISDVYEKRPAVVAFKTPALPLEVKVRGKDPQGNQVDLPINVAQAVPCDFCAQIWARTKLSEEKLSDDEQIQLSLTYGVLCAKTAFVAVHEKKVPGMAPERVEVPVLLPYTWDYDAVFGPDLQGSGMRGLFSLRSSPATYAAGAGGGLDDVLYHKEAGGPVLGRRTYRGRPRMPKPAPTPGPVISTPSPSTPAVGTPEALVAALEELIGKFERGEMTEKDATHLEVTYWSVLRKADLSTWSNELRAKCFYLLVKLTTYSIKGLSPLPEWVKNIKPTQVDAAAQVWLDKASKELGIAV